MTNACIVMYLFVSRTDLFGTAYLFAKLFLVLDGYLLKPFFTNHERIPSKLA